MEVGILSRRYSSSRSPYARLDDTMQLPHQPFVYTRFLELESREVPVRREPGCPELIGEGAYLALCGLGLEQLEHHGLVIEEFHPRRAEDLRPGRGHAVEV